MSGDASTKRFSGEIRLDTTVEKSPDSVACGIRIDTVDVPDDLAAALAKGGVRDAFDAMAFSHRKEWVRAVQDAKRPETRTKRIADCVAAMRTRRAGATKQR